MGGLSGLLAGIILIATAIAIIAAGGEMEPLDLEPDLEARDFTQFVSLFEESKMGAEGRTSQK